MLITSIIGPIIIALNIAGLLFIAGYAMVKLTRRWKLKSDLAAKDHSPIKGKKIQKTKSDEMLFTEGDDLFDDLDLSEFDELSLDDFDK